MKNIFFVLMLMLNFYAGAQISNYENIMFEKVSDIESSLKNSEAIFALGNSFEEIANLEKEQWLPYYYASYCYVMAAFMQKDTSKIDLLAGKAEELLNKADLLNKNNSEITCIRSLIASARIMVNPYLRGMKYGIIAGQMFNKAKLENPDNPRVYFLEAQSLKFMPEEYGGGCKNAKPILETAIEKYSNFKIESNVHPNWGYEGVVELLDECNI